MAGCLPLGDVKLKSTPKGNQAVIHSWAADLHHPRGPRHGQRTNKRSSHGWCFSAWYLSIAQIISIAGSHDELNWETNGWGSRNRFQFTHPNSRCYCYTLDSHDCRQTKNKSAHPRFHFPRPQPRCLCVSC